MGNKRNIKFKPNCSMVHCKNMYHLIQIYLTNKCLLCPHEKLEIINYPRPKELINIKFELISKYCHANKFLLRNYKTNH